MYFFGKVKSYKIIIILYILFPLNPKLKLNNKVFMNENNYKGTLMITF